MNEFDGGEWGRGALYIEGYLRLQGFSMRRGERNTPSKVKPREKSFDSVGFTSWGSDHGQGHPLLVSHIIEEVNAGIQSRASIWLWGPPHCARFHGGEVDGIGGIGGPSSFFKSLSNSADIYFFLCPADCHARVLMR